MTWRLPAILALVAANCLASPIYFWVNDANGIIGEVNPATGAVTLVGNAGVVLTDIAFSPSGALYGITGTGLYLVNTSTGAAAWIGSLGGGVLTANALAFSSSGTLYTADSKYLYSVDPHTGMATEIGPTGYASGGDLAFLGGSLYLTTLSGQLLSLNPSTGAGTVIGNLGVANVFGLASPDNIHLYGVAGKSLYSIDVSIGAATLDTTWAGNAQGLGTAYGETVGPDSGNPSPLVTTVTPEPATLALFGIGCLLLTVTYRLRGAATTKR